MKLTDKAANRFITLVLSGLILVALFFRFWRLDQSPPGFFTDEASIAFNAYSILRSGQDEHFIDMPVYFRAFGEYKNPLYIYAQAALFWVSGVSYYSTRLLAAVLFILTGLLLALLLKEENSNWISARSTVLSGLLIYLITPWTFHLGRVAFELAMFPPIFIASVLFLRRFIDRKHMIWWVYFVSATGLLFYSYTTARFLAPVSFVLALGLLYRQLQPTKAILSCILFATFLLPALLWEISYPGSLTARYLTASTDQTSITYFMNYLKNSNPSFLFFSGDGNLRHMVSKQGLFYLTSVPLFFLGLRQFLQQESAHFKWWIFGIALLSPIPAAISIPAPHVLRGITLLLLISYLVGKGIHSLLELRVSGRILGALSVLLLLEYGLFIHHYFTDYTVEARPWFEADTVEALKHLISDTTSDYVLSSRLYPGTYANAKFELARKTGAPPGAIESAISTETVTRQMLARLATETVVLTRQECSQHSAIIAQRLLLNYQNDSICVISGATKQ